MRARGPGDRPRSGLALVVVMEPADLRDGHHTSERWRVHLSWPWTGVFKRLMGTHGVVVGEGGTQEPAEVGLIQNHEVSQALAAD